mgnify:CR=1 FL=1
MSLLKTVLILVSDAENGPDGSETSGLIVILFFHFCVTLTLLIRIYIVLSANNDTQKLSCDILIQYCEQIITLIAKVFLE